ncbi:MAG TPA: hypothetical protein VI140_09640 [Oxalicibacterium sp.]
MEIVMLMAWAFPDRNNECITQWQHCTLRQSHDRNNGRKPEKMSAEKQLDARMAISQSVKYGDGLALQQRSCIPCKENMHRPASATAKLSYCRLSRLSLFMCGFAAITGIIRFVCP